MIESRLVLNLSKTKALLFGTKQKLKSVSFFNVLLQDKAIEIVSKFKYLGVTLDENFTWKEHVDAVCIKVNKRLGLLARIRSCLTVKASKSVYNCLIHLCRCCVGVNSQSRVATTYSDFKIYFIAIF